MSAANHDVTLGERSLARQYHAFYPWSALTAEDVIIIERGEGVYVFDTRGKRYLDAISGGWNVTQGFSCAPLVAAATSQLERLPYYHTLYNRVSDVSVRLSEALTNASGQKSVKAIYSNSGSEAVEAAVKMAWLYHMAQGQVGRRKIITRLGSVHGSTLYASCIGGLGLHEIFGAHIGGILRVGSPNQALYGAPGESPAAFTDRVLREVEEVIDQEGADTIAAMIIEPIPVVEGFQVPPAGYLQRLTKLLSEHGILLICDEVVTAFGRTGALFASDTLGVSADMMVVGKTLTSGYAALAATLLSPRVAAAVDTCCGQLGEFPHALTTGMHPVAMRVALRNLELLQESTGVMAHVAAISPLFRSQIEELGALEGVSRSSVTGLGGSIHLAPAAGHDDLAFEVAHACRARGLFVHGQHGALIVAPPLVISRNELHELFEIMRDAYRAVLNKGPG